MLLRRPGQSNGGGPCAATTDSAATTADPVGPGAAGPAAGDRQVVLVSHHPAPAQAPPAGGEPWGPAVELAQEEHLANIARHEPEQNAAFEFMIGVTPLSLLIGEGWGQLCLQQHHPLELLYPLSWQCALLQALQVEFQAAWTSPPAPSPSQNGSSAPQPSHSTASHPLPNGVSNADAGTGRRPALELSCWQAVSRLGQLAQDLDDDPAANEQPASAQTGQHQGIC